MNILTINIRAVLTGQILFSSEITSYIEQNYFIGRCELSFLYQIRINVEGQITKVLYLV